MSPARTLAFEILRAVEAGGFASDLLAARATGLDARDAGLASEIVLGSLRFQAQLDFLIERYARRPASRLDGAVRIALRMGIYQLRYLDRIPPHAAVDESVELVKRSRVRSAAGLVNAVLRKITREPVSWPSREIELSHPAWLLERWDAQYGREIADRIARANLLEPERYIRVPPGADLSGVAVEGTPIPGCYKLLGGDPDRFRLQDIGSQSVVPLLSLAPGQTFLDVCAAPGNKTAQALDSGVRAVACDVHPRRLAALRTLGIPLAVVDGTRPLPWRTRFDRILVDAPCSGTGTLARNPEIKWRLTLRDIQELARLQVLLLKHAQDVLAPGGILVYSTCSLEREENEEVIAQAAAYRVKDVMRRIPGRDPGDGFFAAVLEYVEVRK